MDWTFIVPVVTLAALVAGVVQTVTGFGAGIIMMLFFPLFLPILKASALSTLITLYLTISLTIQLRRSADRGSILLPLFIFFVTSAAAIRLASTMETRLLSLIFGFFLVALALYFSVAAKSIRLQATHKNCAICAALSGCASGFFGISGPPMVIYYLAALGDDKTRYLATTQLFFCLSSLYTTGVRIAHGIITPDLLPLALCGMLGIFFGKRIGLAVLSRIDADTMKRFIYIFLALAGVITVVKNML